MTELAPPADAAPAGDVGDGTSGDPAPAPKWYDTLPDTLKADPTITRFDSLEAAAASIVEAKKLITSGDKLIVPGADTPPDEWAAVWAKLGRPESADGYDIPTIEGDSGDYAAAFKPVAHNLGLNAAQAKGLAEWQNAMVQEATQAKNTADAEALTALKAEYKDGFAAFEAAATAGFNAFIPIIGGVVDPADTAAVDARNAKVLQISEAMAESMGRAEFVKLWGEIGKRMGEAQRIEGDPANALGLDKPQGDLNSLVKDTEFIKKVLDNPGGPEAQRYNQILAAAKTAASRS